ncbi:MAG: SufE family protein [Rhodothermales bacterium]
MADTIADRTAEIVEEFALFDDWFGRYEHLIEQGRDLPEIEDEYKTEDYRIRGCQSQVWMRAEHTDGDTVHYKADSDALITRGLVALMIRVLDRQPADAIVDADLGFLDAIGMNEHLSSTRKNGLHAMIKQMKRYALALTNG